MLVSKFSISVTRYTSLNNLINLRVLVRSASKSSCSDDIKRNCKPREKVGGRIIRSRCEEYRTAVAKCPKTSCKTVSQIPPPKCNSTTSDTYLNSLKTIEDYAKKISKFTNESTAIILHDSEAAIQQKKNEESLKRQEILKGIENKIWELINLDATCGINKKWEILMINDKVAQKLKFWQLDNSPEVKFLKFEIENLKNESKFQLDNAIALIKSCRECISPLSLKECVEKNTKVALQNLDKVNENTSKKIADMQNSKTRILKDFGEVLEDITESYRKEIADFSEYLSKYMDSIKKQGSVNKKL